MYPLESIVYALFCTTFSSKLFFFNSFRTLCEKHGRGGVPSQALPNHGSNICSIHIHGDGPLDQVKRYHHTDAALPPLQHAFEPRKGSSSDSHAPAHRQKWMRLRTPPLRKSRAHDFHFRVRQRGRQSAKPD